MKKIFLSTCFSVLLAGLEAFGQNPSPPADSLLAQHIQLLKKGKFSIGNSTPLPVEKHLIGFSYGYTQEFQTAFSANPYAARELRKSYQYQAMETGGKVIFYTLLVKSFIYTVMKAKKVREGNFYGNPTPVVDAANLTVSAGIAFYGGIKKWKQQKKAVRVFNGAPIHK